MPLLWPEVDFYYLFFVLFNQSLNLRRHPTVRLVIVRHNHYEMTQDAPDPIAVRLELSLLVSFA